MSTASCEAPGPPDLRGAPEGLPGTGKPRALAAGQALWLIVADAPVSRYGEAAAGARRARPRRGVEVRGGPFGGRRPLRAAASRPPLPAPDPVLERRARARPGAPAPRRHRAAVGRRGRAGRVGRPGAPRRRRRGVGPARAGGGAARDGRAQPGDSIPRAPSPPARNGARPHRRGASGGDLALSRARPARRRRPPAPPGIGGRQAGPAPRRGLPGASHARRAVPAGGPGAGGGGGRQGPPRPADGSMASVQLRRRTSLTGRRRARRSRARAAGRRRVAPRHRGPRPHQGRGGVGRRRARPGRRRPRLSAAVGAPVRRRSTHAAAGPEMSVLYLYALVGDSPRSDAGRGLRRERLKVLPGRGFHVVAGGWHPPAAASTNALRRHDAVVRRIAATVDAILPMRFGSAVPDEDAATRLLDPARHRAGGTAGPGAWARADDPSRLRPPPTASRARARSRNAGRGSARPGSAVPRRAQAPPRRRGRARAGSDSPAARMASSPTSGSSVTPPHRSSPASTTWCRAAGGRSTGRAWPRRPPARTAPSHGQRSLAPVRIRRRRVAVKRRRRPG